MSQRNLMIFPTMSSNISFCSDVEIHYMDMTAPHKQELEHRLRDCHTTHNIHMWVSHFIVEVPFLSTWHVDLGHLLYTNYSPLLQWFHSFTDRKHFPEIPLKTQSPVPTHFMN